MKHKQNDYLERNIRSLNLHLCRPENIVENELPRIRPCFVLPERLISFKECLHSKDYEAGVHFFLDDVEFEKLWRNPEIYLRILAKFACVIAPDFSIYWDAPNPLQHFNLYRSRMMCQYFQDNGLNVIATVPFAGYEFNHFALLGLEKHSMVAVSTVGCRRDHFRRMSFQAGLDILAENLHPSLLIVYGDPDTFNYHNLNLKSYDHFKIPNHQSKGYSAVHSDTD